MSAPHQHPDRGLARFPEGASGPVALHQGRRLQRLRLWSDQDRQGARGNPRSAALRAYRRAPASAGQRVGLRDLPGVRGRRHRHPCLSRQRVRHSRPRRQGAAGRARGQGPWRAVRRRLRWLQLFMARGRARLCAGLHPGHHQLRPSAVQRRRTGVFAGQRDDLLHEARHDAATRRSSASPSRRPGHCA